MICTYPGSFELVPSSELGLCCVTSLSFALLSVVSILPSTTLQAMLPCFQCNFRILLVSQNSGRNLFFMVFETDQNMIYHSDKELTDKYWNAWNSKRIPITPSNEPNNNKLLINNRWSMRLSSPFLVLSILCFRFCLQN